MSNLQACLICERVLQEKDGVISAMRIIDGLINPQPRKSLTQALTVLILVRSNSNQDEHVPVLVQVKAPSGAIIHSMEMTAQGKDQNLIMQMQVQFNELGLHHFNVYLNGEFANTIPLRIIGPPSDNKSPMPQDNMGIGELVKGQIYSS